MVLIKVSLNLLPVRGHITVDLFPIFLTHSFFINFKVHGLVSVVVKHVMSDSEFTYRHNLVWIDERDMLHEHVF